MKCLHCGKLNADRRHPDWPENWQPQGPDDVPPGFCNGIGCAPGAQGEAGQKGNRQTQTGGRLKYLLARSQKLRGR